MNDAISKPLSKTSAYYIYIYNLALERRTSHFGWWYVFKVFFTQKVLKGYTANILWSLVLRGFSYKQLH